MGLLYSLNYDHRPASGLSLRGGASVLPLCLWGSCALIPLVLLGASGLIGGPDHYFEMGGGMITAISDGDLDSLWAANIGYRYQPAQGGFLFRATATPLVGGYAVLPWAGLSFGYAW
jgi:hypothetical protein